MRFALLAAIAAALLGASAAGADSGGWQYGSSPIVAVAFPPVLTVDCDPSTDPSCAVPELGPGDPIDSAP